MKKYVKEYAGFQVPNGAKYFTEDSRNQGAGFYKWSDNELMFFSVSNCRGWVKSVNSEIPSCAIELPEAPQEWMPKVGFAYEVRFKDGAFRHRDVCKIIAIGKEWCV